MIIRKKTGLFGGKITAIHTQGFKCTVITQREGIFRPFVTLIREGDADNGGNPLHISGRISYFPEFEKRDIKELHEAIVQSLQDDGEKGFPLGAAIEGVMADTATETGRAVPLGAAGSSSTAASAARGPRTQAARASCSKRSATGTRTG